MAGISIAYMTARREPRLEWFARSLMREAGGDLSSITPIIVDLFAEPQKPEDNWTVDDALARTSKVIAAFDGAKMRGLLHVPPMGNPFCGPMRYPKENWFAKSEFLNTAVCYCDTEWLVSVDDLSVLCPGWLEAVKRAIKSGVVCCGHYQKVKHLVVEDGEIKGFEPYAAGMDHRGTSLVEPCHPAWFYGCSFVVPVDAILKINGWPTTSSTMGYEDSVTGAVLARTGRTFRFDPAMKTLESEEDHHIGAQMRREDPGVSPNDMSHAFLRMHEGATRFENYFGPDGLAGLRRRVLAGEPMPALRIPEHRWYDAKPLRDL